MTNKEFYAITEWTACVTDDHKPHYSEHDIPGETISFRLLDDDDNIYMYGVMSMEAWDEGTEEYVFAPLDDYMYVYGVTSIEYLNPDTKEWEVI